MLKKLLLTLAASLCLLIISLGFWLNTVTPLTKQEQMIVQQVMTSSLPEMISGEQGYAKSGKIKIWYEIKKPPAINNQHIKGSVLLINGLGASAMFWPPEIIEPLLSLGYQVIITYHRGVGNSDWHTDEYDLSDLVKDNIAVLDSLKINQAHVLGLSLGGMIGQEMALEFPHRVSSLISAMSSGFTADPELSMSSSFKSDAIKLLLRYGFIPTEENTIKMIVGIYKLLNAQADIDVKRLATATLYDLRQRKGFNHKLAEQQAAAIDRSGSRYDRLPSMQVPTLVIHGQDDPLVNIAHAEKYAKLIPRVQTLWVAGMGHALAPSTIDVWMEAALAVIEANNNG